MLFRCRCAWQFKFFSFRQYHIEFVGVIYIAFLGFFLIKFDNFIKTCKMALFLLFKRVSKTRSLWFHLFEVFKYLLVHKPANQKGCPIGHLNSCNICLLLSIILGPSGWPCSFLACVIALKPPHPWVASGLSLSRGQVLIGSLLESHLTITFIAFFLSEQALGLRVIVNIEGGCFAAVSGVV